MSKRKNNWLDMSLTTNVIVRLELEGLHNWPAADQVFPEVGFLSYMHRHKWFITAKKQVFHDDRDVEFIMFKRDVMDYLNTRYYRSDYRSHYFGAKSCEMIADELYKAINDKYPGRFVRISVAEDNENGCEMDYPVHSRPLSEEYENVDSGC